MFKLDIKLIFYNFLFFLLFVFFLETLLGRWWTKTPALDIKHTVVDKDIKYDGSIIFGAGKDSLIKYTRDKEGYRSYDKEAKNYVLTVGGSTTDQRLINDGYTFQDVIKAGLDKNFSVINGGVDGQTSYGHLISIKNWHSKVLNKSRVKKVIFLIGANDHHFLKTCNLLIKDSKCLTLEQYVRDSNLHHRLKQRSFFYYWTRRIILRFTKQIVADGILKTGHGIKNPKYIADNSINNYEQISINKNSEEYKSLMKNLVIETNKAFPNGDIIIVQQQDPKCSFKSDFLVAARAINPSIKKVFKNSEYNPVLEHCKVLGKVYLTQDKAFEELSRTKNYHKLKVIKMYIDSPIPNNGFYDGIHTNNYGASVLGRYLLKKLDF